MDKNVNTENMLNDLLEKSYDAQRGYADASTNTDNVHLKRWLTQQGVRRTQFAAQLGGQMKQMNLEPKNDGSMTGDLHRGWLNLKTALSLNSDEAILEEALRGEQATLDEYNEVLQHKKELPPSTVEIIQNQWAQVQETVNTIKRLEDIAEEK